MHVVLLILIFCIQKVSGDVNYTLIQGLNQVYNVANSKASTTTVKYLGLTNSSAKCADLCVAHAIRCWSFTWHNIPGNFYHQCFGILSPRWSPTPDSEEIVSGIIEWPCRNDHDCSLNGICSQDNSGDSLYIGKSCKCDSSWSGKRCETLKLLPATRGARYRGVDNGHNTSSWGGAVVKGIDGRYHLYAAEITEHCGIGAWNTRKHR